MVTIDEIKRLVSVQLGVKHIREEDLFMEDLGAESADLVNIIAAVEEKYRVTIGEAEISGIRSVFDLYKHVQDLLS